MPWYLSNSDMLDAMAEIAGDPEKLAAFKDSPYEYLSQNTNLSEDDMAAITSPNHEDVVNALMSKLDPES